MRARHVAGDLLAHRRAAARRFDRDPRRPALQSDAGGGARLRHDAGPALDPLLGRGTVGGRRVHGVGAGGLVARGGRAGWPRPLEQIHRRLPRAGPAAVPADEPRAVELAETPGKCGPRRVAGAAGVCAGDPVERAARLGLVPLPGRAHRRRRPRSAPAGQFRRVAGWPDALRRAGVGGTGAHRRRVVFRAPRCAVARPVAAGVDDAARTRLFCLPHAAHPRRSELAPAALARR